MTIDINRLATLTEDIVREARQSDEVYAITGCDEETSSQEKEIAFLSALARAFRKRGVNVRSMTREVSFFNQFEEGHDYTTPIYYLNYQGQDFASHNLLGTEKIWEGMHRLIDTDHHGVECSGWGDAHDISAGEDADPQECLHDWFDQALGAHLAHAQAHTLDRQTPRKAAAKKPRNRM